MTKEEAEAVAKAVQECGCGGPCDFCVANVCERLNEARLGWVFEPQSAESGPDPVVKVRRYL